MDFSVKVERYDGKKKKKKRVTSLGLPKQNFDRAGKRIPVHKNEIEVKRKNSDKGPKTEVDIMEEKKI